jgi:outer membrane biosynthesis protein TonB
MHEPVDDVVDHRKEEPKGLRRAMSASLAVHFGIVLVLFFAPPDLFTHAKEEPILMRISLGGSEGEKTTGTLSAGGRTIEEKAPPTKRPEPPPIPTPSKTAPVVATPKKTPEPTSKPAPSSTPAARPPVTGPEVTKGNAKADTGATGQGTGLQTGGGGLGGQVQVDPDFCCPAYIAEIERRIVQNWNKNQPEAGTTLVVFEIQRDGTFTRPKIEKSSGRPMLDIASLATFDKLVLPALPKEYKGDRLTVHLSFPYVR